jgi:hypothetical protein
MRGRALAPKTADSQGLVSWHWPIGKRMACGAATVTIEAEGLKTTAAMSVGGAPAAQSERRLRLLAS